MLIKIATENGSSMILKKAAWKKSCFHLFFSFFNMPLREQNNKNGLGEKSPRLLIHRLYKILFLYPTWWFLVCICLNCQRSHTPCHCVQCFVCEGNTIPIKFVPILFCFCSFMQTKFGLFALFCSPPQVTTSQFNNNHYDDRKRHCSCGKCARKCY